MKRINSFVLICILINLFGCHYGKSVSSSEKVEKTCLVLSVGSSKGIAQIGAIDAIKDSGVQIDYVFGNSIGSAIGGIYAFDPSRNLKQTIKKIFKDYKMATKKDKEESATTGFLVGVGLMFLSGGAFGWETVLGSTYLGSESEQLVDNDRFKRVLDKHFKRLESRICLFLLRRHTRSRKIAVWSYRLQTTVTLQMQSPKAATTNISSKIRPLNMLILVLTELG